ncbi:MAG: CDGSH iron-sulfur domain-containing protein [Planctomycetota bacterium]|nr:CDGSH iron-sulfur domain-containing protein [Planctomycetota bacterium]
MSTEIQAFDNGPLLVKGDDVVLKDGEGAVFNLEGKPSIALCRCGQSANKPFCDGSHQGASFESSCRAS